MSGSPFPQPLWEQLLQQILWEQTTFYNSASYCGRLHYSHLCYGRLCFAHCRDMHGMAPHLINTLIQLHKLILPHQLLLTND